MTHTPIKEEAPAYTTVVQTATFATFLVAFFPPHEGKLKKAM